MSSLPTQPDLEAAAQKMLAADRLSNSLGVELRAIGTSRATMSLTVGDDMVNGHAICHGGVVFALADSASAYASNSWGPDAVTAMASVEYFSPALQGETLTATAQETQRVGRKALVDVAVTGPDGRLIAALRCHTTQLRIGP